MRTYRLHQLFHRIIYFHIFRFSTFLSKILRENARLNLKISKRAGISHV